MTASAHKPKVSCLLVTADRPTLCRRALRSYQLQHYPNKELIVLDNGARPVESLLADLPSDEVHYLYVHRGPRTFIGGLRNIALGEATGEYVIPQWDDDDWSHPERITRQVAKLEEGFDACTLAGTLMHVDHPDYFDHPFVGLLKGGVPPTIMHRRHPNIRYPDLRRTSDTAYVKDWQAHRYAQLPLSESHLYVRFFHGDNLWEMQHFLRRMRNTPVDLMRYAWYRYVRDDLFSHPRFHLSAPAREAFAHYLRDSRDLAIF